MRGVLAVEREKHSISIRLNGKEQKVREVTDEIVAAQENEFIDDEIIPKPDNVIDFGKLQDERKRNGQPYWDDGNREKSPKLPFKRKKKPFSEVKKPRLPMMLITALLAAVVIGLGLGFMVLTVFTGNDQEVADGGAVATGAIPTFSDEKTGLPVLSVEVVQGGAFSDAETGAQTVARLHEQGLAATLTQTTDPIYMFIGVGGDRSQASQVGALYEAYGQETYLKSYRIDGQALAEQEVIVSNWFTNALNRYKELLQLSVDGLDGGAMITVERVKQLEQSLESLQAERDQVFSQLPQQAQPHALAMGGELVNAVDTLTLYADTSDERALWQTQQALLEALVHYEEVVQSLQ